MITNQYILDLVNFIQAKEQKGNAITPDEYGDILIYIQRQYFEKLISLYESDSNNTQSISRFKVYKGLLDAQLSINANGIATLPNDYRKFDYATYKETIDAVVYYRDVDLCTSEEFKTRLASYSYKPTTKHPICKQMDGQLWFEPKTLAGVDFQYIRQPIDPIYDYYIDANGNYQYLDVSEVHTWTTGETDSSGVVHNSGTYTSTTVELDLEEEDKLKVIGLILSLIGINLSDNQITQYAELLKAQDK